MNNFFTIKTRCESIQVHTNTFTVTSSHGTFNHPHTNSTPILQYLSSSNGFSCNKLNAIFPQIISIASQVESKEKTQKIPSTISATKCPICIESFCGKDPVSTMCGHVFCMICIKNYLSGQKNPKCPLCNENLPNEKSFHRIYL